jgi:Tol biopolymer transport system component
VTGVSWTPDGKIVYATNAGGKWEIWKIEADGTGQKQLTQNCAGNDSCSLPMVSPDGRYIVFQARRGGIPYIWRMDADGANARQLTEDDGLHPFFTPDGGLVIFIRRTPLSTLWQIPIEGGKPEQFSKLVPAGPASISPDGKQLAFSTFDKQPFQTCVAPVGADAPEKCFVISRSFPRWALDGKAFYYLDYDFTAIWKQPLDGERELFLKFTGEQTNNFAFSPDGRRLVVARSKPTQDIVALTDEH